jgi:hypothetical protein
VEGPGIIHLRFYILANPNPRKKNKARGKTSKGKKGSKMIAPQDICDKDILAKHEMCSTSKSKLFLTF